MKQSIWAQRNSWLILAWCLMVSINILQLTFYKWRIAPTYAWSKVFTFPIIGFVVGLCLIFGWLLPGLNWSKRLSRWSKIPFFLVHGFLYGAFFIYLAFAFFIAITPTYSFGNYQKSVAQFFATDFHNISKNYIYCVAIYFAYEYFQGQVNIINEKNQLAQALNQVNLANLKAKLQPHFLFNTLNSAVALIDEDKPKAQKALIHLSDLLRFSVDSQVDHLIPIDQEIELLKKYLFIEKARYEEQLIVDWIWDNKTHSFLLPVMLLQPIVENCIKHGFKKYQKSLTIIIEIVADKKEIIIKNNGQALHSPVAYGTGLTLVQQRLTQHYQNASFIIYQEKEWIINHIALQI